ncbi:hypothetical protein LTR70_001102 [Exophiala xenobiotica]|uniref:Uncharacterized protein n=1 Tax=Lithohypha guttulata TaxID=1690604 RepID=A0ABR0KMQ5_9EURO|nr:hypothetical protein LTR24_000708 [Lithohypha guttulata]KAK5328948.1 hypothetical protein LTR70_001102 [Exophiala xenobiotica]
MAGAETSPSTVHGHGYTGPITVTGGVAILGDVVLSASERHKRTECLQTFKTSTYESYKNAPNPKPEPGTCQWILQHPKFRNWDGSDHKTILWLSADPGCRKSVFSRYYVDMLQAAGDATVCYFFFKDNAEQNDLNIAVCAILHQLFSDQPQLISVAIPSWERNKTLIQRETGTLWRTLQGAMLASQKKIICVLDALDECSGADRDQLIEMLFDLTTTYSRASTDCNLQHLKLRLPGEHDNKEINREINMVIERQVNALAKQYKLSEDNQYALQSHLIHMEHRTYLWLHLAMSAVRNQYRYSLHPNKVNIAELSLPLNVGAAYDQVLSKIDPALKGRVVNILLVVVGARRPLTIHALFTALNVLSCDRPDEFLLEDFDEVRFEKQIRDWCGLFTYVEQSRVYLIHQTAKEYLLARAQQSPLQQWQGCLAQLDVERTMALMCLKYLCIPGIEPYDKRDAVAWAVRTDRYTGEYGDGASLHDFYHYCAEHWASHLQECNEASLDQDLHKYISIVGQPSKTEIWSEVMWYPYRSGSASMQHVLAAHGHAVALKCLHSIGDVNWNASDSIGRTALHWAASAGDVPTVRLLIDIGSDIDKREGDNCDWHLNDGQPRKRGKGRTALHFAVMGGHPKTVELLLDSGADVDVECYEGLTPLESIVHQYKGCSSDLLRAFIGRSSTGKLDALCVAAETRDNETVKLLIESGTDVNAMNRRSKTALCAAVCSDCREVAATLLAADADINQRSPGHKSWTFHKSATPLTLGLSYASRPFAEFLLEAAADIDMPNEGGDSVLQLACAKCTCEVVQMLLDHKHKNPAPDALPEQSMGGIAQHLSADHQGFYDGALASAVQYENLRVVDLLFSRAPLAVQGENFDAALLVAATKDSLAPMQALLSHATKQIDTNFYQKLLVKAARSATSYLSRGKILGFLLKYKPEPLSDTDFREMIMESIRGSVSSIYGDRGKLACRLMECGKDAMSRSSYLQVLKVLVGLSGLEDGSRDVVKTVMEQISTNVHGGTLRSPAVEKAPAFRERFEALKTFLEQQPDVYQNEDFCRDIVYKALHFWRTGPSIAFAPPECRRDLLLRRSTGKLDVKGHYCFHWQHPAIGEMPLPTVQAQVYSNAGAHSSDEPAESE